MFGMSEELLMGVSGIHRGKGPKNALGFLFSSPDLVVQTARPFLHLRSVCIYAN